MANGKIQLAELQLKTWAKWENGLLSGYHGSVTWWTCLVHLLKFLWNSSLSDSYLLPGDENSSWILNTTEQSNRTWQMSFCSRKQLRTLNTNAEVPFEAADELIIIRLQIHHFVKADFNFLRLFKQTLLCRFCNFLQQNIESCLFPYSYHEGENIYIWKSWKVKYEIAHNKNTHK